MIKQAIVAVLLSPLMLIIMSFAVLIGAIAWICKEDDPPDGIER
jgi:hypothetical protein